MLRIFSSLKFWSLLIGFALTILLWHIQMWTNPEHELTYPFNNNAGLKLIYTDFLWPNKIQIGIYSGILLFLSQIFLTLIPQLKKNREYLKAVINHILYERFKGDLEHTRITIFKIDKGFVLMFKYVWKCFVVNFFKHKKKGILLNHFRLIPNPFRHYLVMYARRSHPNEKGTSTIFPIATNEKEISGIASYVLFKGTSHKIDIESISDIDVTKFDSIDKLPLAKARRIKRYMVATKLKDFNRLKCFHRLSNHIWANPIYDKDEKQWGVLVVDNESVETNIFDSIEKELESYTRILGLSVIHLKY